MGYSSYSDDFYRDRVATRAAKGVPTFVHDHAVRTGTAKSILHDSLNILDKIRESRDSKEHPESVPIAVVFDVTGSMSTVPVELQKKLPQLMGLLLRKGYVQHPQVLFGAVGDFYSDKVPIQMGQFESGLEMDDNITHIFLEGGGGGSKSESYQNALYFFAHRTSCDAWEKRGKKGYLFLIGDEMAYKESTTKEIKALIKSDAQSGDSLEGIMKAVLEKWEVFFILPNGTNYYDDPEIKKFWSGLVGPERFIKLADPSAVCETIGLAIGLLEGTTTGDAMAADLTATGASAGIVHATTVGLDGLAKSTSLAKVGTGSLPEKKGHSKTTERL